MRVFLAIVFLAPSFLIPLFFDELLRFFTIHLNSGWVFGSIYLRLLVIIFFSIALYLVLSLFNKTKHLKFIYVFLIALLPGFGISFIAPIYNVDYGMFDDSKKLKDLNALSEATAGKYNFDEKRSVLAFFTTTCPHCMAVCQKLSYNEKAGQKIDVHVFFPGKREAADRFLSDNHGENFSSYLIGENADFVKFAGNTYPSVYLIGPNGETEMHISGDKMNYTTMDYLLELSPNN